MPNTDGTMQHVQEEQIIPMGLLYCLIHYEHILYIYVLWIVQAIPITPIILLLTIQILPPQRYEQHIYQHEHIMVHILMDPSLSLPVLQIQTE